MKDITVVVKKPQSMKNALTKALADAKAYGVSATFDGDEHRGIGKLVHSLATVKGNYKVNQDRLEVTVTEKPFVLSEKKIRKAISKYCATL